MEERDLILNTLLDRKSLYAEINSSSYGKIHAHLDLVHFFNNDLF